MVKRNTSKFKISNGVYLDYAATTPIDPGVLKAMLPYLKERYGNPSTIYSLGEEAEIAIDKARKNLAKFLNCQPEEIIFTGSATEANNLAIKGLIKAVRNSQPTIKPHIITTMIEHHAVLEPLKALEKEGAETTYLPVNKNGLINISDLAKAIKENTVLVSVMYANNEIGSTQPLAQIGKLIKHINNLKEKSGNLKTYFHTDAVQAINYLDCNVNRLGVDLLALSAHKIYGPKGVGALYIRKGIPIEPQIYGGGQESGLRSGTENVAGIVGLGTAINKIKSQKSKIKIIEKLRNRLIKGILAEIPDAQLNSPPQNSLPNIVNFSFPGAEGEAIVLDLSRMNIFVSTGSACSSKSLEPSHVLISLGLTEEEAHSSIRFSLGRNTTQQEIDFVLKILPGVVERFRKISGYK